MKKHKFTVTWGNDYQQNVYSITEAIEMMNGLLKTYDFVSIKKTLIIRKLIY